nr:helix-turn-helix transcriptional regulator [uncultured Cohaesibacter sp.]
MTKRYGKSAGELQRWYLREWRKHRGMTQEQLAEAIDSTKQTVSRMESGQTPYNQPFLEACAEALDCEPWELLKNVPISDSEFEKIVVLLERRPSSFLQRAYAMLSLLDEQQ